MQVYKFHLIEWDEAIYGIQRHPTTCTMWPQESNGSWETWRQVPFPAEPSHLPSSSLHHIIRQKPKITNSETPPQASHLMLLHVLLSLCIRANSLNYAWRNNLAPGARSKLIHLLHVIKAEKFPSSALMGSNTNSLHGTQIKDWPICWCASQLVTQPIKSFLHDAGIPPLLQVRQPETTENLYLCQNGTQDSRSS